MQYSVVIRTLGTAGKKYQAMLDSLSTQTIKPNKIIVYIAEGYSTPRESIGIEEYIYVKKGMVAQRALPYHEVDTEYILFLDDDLCFPPNFVETLYREMMNNEGNVISPDIYIHHKHSIKGKIMMALSGRMVPHVSKKWAFKILRGGGFSYNNSPFKKTYQSETNAGACFLCKKVDFLRIHFEDELWMDNLKYPLGEDQVMFYKMHCMGLKVLTIFGSGIEHLDAGSSTKNEEKEKTLIYSDLFFKLVFWHRFFYHSDNLFMRIWDVACIVYPLSLTFLISLVKGRIGILKLKHKAIKDGISFIQSDTYKRIPPIYSN